MQWTLLAIATIAVVELVLRLKVADTVRRLLDVVRKVARVARSDKISDHWKERAMLAYSGRMMAASLKLLLLFLLALSPVAVLAAVGAAFDVPLLDLLMRPLGLVASILIACAYLPLRRRLHHV